MGYEPLHHKYRPQNFSQLVGQDAIAQTLSHALEQQRIAPAYLFCGPRGTGKTSSARILAKSLNCLSHPVPNPQPCGQCEVCRGISNGSILDIVEIDAASNTGVDNIRELIERAQFAPVQCRYKVYVVDECHMLSTAAFNALLKTLEEPPEHVIFVLATTDPQRVLPTIISRCQRFDFRRIPLEAMVSHLQAIAQHESIDITEDAVRLVAQVAQGGLRDAESLLDQLSLLEPPITAEKVWDLVGAVPERDLLELVQAIAADDSVTTLDTVRRLMDRGREPMIVLQNLAGFYRDLIIAKTAGGRADLVPVTPPTWEAMKEFSQSVALPLLLVGQKTLREAETQLRNTTQPRLWLEVTLMNLLPSAQVGVAAGGALSPAPVQPSVSAPSTAAPPRPVSPPPQPQPIPTAEPSPPPSPQPVAFAPASPSVPSSSPPAQATPAAETPIPPPADVTPAAAPATDLAGTWAQIIAQVKPLGTRALLQQQGHLISYSSQAARVGIKSEKLLKMAQSKLPNIEAAFAKLFGQTVKVTLEVADAPPGSQKMATATTSPPPNSDRPAPPLSPPETPTSAPSPANSAPSVVAEAPTPSPPPSEPPPTVANPANWQPESDLDRAVKSFAEFFNGQIVDMGDDAEEEGKNGKAKKQGGKSKPSSSPGSDVPF
jgi:DNA polymerase-3 subunit gamma/tau